MTINSVDILFSWYGEDKNSLTWLKELGISDKAVIISIHTGGFGKAVS